MTETSAPKESAVVTGTIYRLGRGVENLPAQRTFRLQLSRTLAQDIWMTNVVRRAGLDRVELPASQDLTAQEGFLTALVTKIFQAELVGDLLAGVLMREDRTSWYSEDAPETSRFIMGLKDEDEKKSMLDLLSRVLFHFLSGARNSS
jgi:hypothetical protein